MKEELSVMFRWNTHVYTYLGESNVGIQKGGVVVKLIYICPSYKGIGMRLLIPVGAQLAKKITQARRLIGSGGVCVRNRSP